MLDTAGVYPFSNSYIRCKVTFPVSTALLPYHCLYFNTYHIYHCAPVIFYGNIRLLFLKRFAHSPLQGICSSFDEATVWDRSREQVLPSLPPSLSPSFPSLYISFCILCPCQMPYVLLYSLQYNPVYTPCTENRRFQHTTMFGFLFLMGLSLCLNKQTF